MKYRFTVNGRVVLPNYKQDMAIEHTKEQGEQFYRARLSGSLKFMGSDFDFLDACGFETEINLIIEKVVGGFEPIFPVVQNLQFNIVNGKLEPNANASTAVVATLGGGTFRLTTALAANSGKIGFLREGFTDLIEAGTEVFYERATGGSKTVQITVPDDMEYLVWDIGDGAGVVTADNLSTQELNSEVLWTGVFYKTDGKWDFDNKIVEIKAEPKDIYTELLTGMDREYNLIELAPPIYPVLVDKRPLIQIYQAGSSTVGCFLGGNAWEQDVASPVWNVDAGHEESLQQKYHFSETGAFYEVTITEIEGYTPSPGILGKYSGTTQSRLDGPEGHYIVIRPRDSTESYLEVKRISDDYTVAWTPFMRWGHPSVLAGESSPAPPNAVEALAHKRSVFSRYLTSLPEKDGQTIHRLPSDDITPNNGNYQYAVEYASGGVTFSSRVSSEPSKFGRREFEWLNPAEPEYYLPPTDGDFLYYPISRLNWGYHSIWFRFREDDAPLERSLRTVYTMPDAFKLVDAIKVLAEKIIGSSIEVRATELEMGVVHMITPKSNITAGSYSLAAQRAPVKLKELLAMLKDIFQSYWYLKMEDGKLILDIQPISWFNERPTSVDTTEITNIRNGLPWSFATDKVEYNKLDMPSRYEFGWAEPTSILFDGEPIEIQSKFVERDKVESISITKFNTDIDFMLLAPEKVNPDGFALLKTKNGEVMYLIEPGAAYKELQNGHLSWYQLHEDTWCVDMPAERALVNGHLRLFYDNEIVKNKKQTISFPVEADPAPELLIKTSVGLGKIEKLSVYLHSRMAKADLRQNTYD